jgi:O-antigen ligase
MIAILMLSAVLSPVWKTGAILHTIDFSKIFVAWVLILLVISTFQKLKKIIYIQSASVLMVCVISILKGRNHPRLEGVLGGIYSNANDLAFAIVLALPFCLAFLINSKGMVRKLLWFAGILMMLAALFLTASRAGFVDLVVSGVVCLWHFGVKGKRLYLIVGATVVVIVLGATLGGKLKQRFDAIETETRGEAYDSFVLRKQLMEESIAAMEHYPILGLGVNNFKVYSGTAGGPWLAVHNAYLLIAAEGGIPALILYLLFFARGFRNLRLLLRMRDLDPEMRLFIGAMHTSLVGFAVGALFAPESYHFFSYFAVAYSATLLTIISEQRPTPAPERSSPLSGSRSPNIYSRHAAV